MRGLARNKKCRLSLNESSRHLTRLSDRRAGDNAAGFHANFRNGDVNHFGHLINDFAFDLHGAIFLAANQFVAYGVQERCRDKRHGLRR